MVYKVRNRCYLSFLKKKNQKQDIDPGRLATPAKTSMNMEHSGQSHGDTAPIVTTRAGRINVRPQYLCYLVIHRMISHPLFVDLV